MSGRPTEAVHLLEPGGNLVPTGRHWGRQHQPIDFKALPHYPQTSVRTERTVSRERDVHDQ